MIKFELIFNGMKITQSFNSNPALFSRPSSSSSSSSLLSSKKALIDGSKGTTGLQARERLSKRDDMETSKAPSELREDEATCRAHSSKVDAVTLCFPDGASIEAASLVNEDDNHTALIDVSTDFLCNNDWAHGFPELSEKKHEDTCNSKRIANPGCCPTGFAS